MKVKVRGIHMVYVNKFWATYRKDEFYIELRLEGPETEEKSARFTPLQGKLRYC